MDLVAIVDTVEYDDLECLQYLGDRCDQQFNPNVVADYANNPLIHLALKNNSKRVVTWLLSLPTLDINLRDDDYGNTVLMTAADYAMKNGGDFDNFWRVLSYIVQQQLVETLAAINSYNFDLIEMLSTHQYNDLIKYLYQHHAQHLKPARNLLTIASYHPDNPSLLNFLVNQVITTNDESLADGQLLIALSKLDLEDGEFATHAISTFERILRNTTNLNCLDNNQLTASNYCAINNNLTCLKKLLMTGKVDISQHRLLHKVKAIKTRQLIEDYFKSPVDCIAVWRKELDTDRGPAADLFVLQLLCSWPTAAAVTATDVVVTDTTTNTTTKKGTSVDSRVIRFFNILRRLGDDVGQVICLKSCDTTGQHTYIPDSYIKLAQADLSNASK